MSPRTHDAFDPSSSEFDHVNGIESQITNSGPDSSALPPRPAPSLSKQESHGSTGYGTPKPANSNQVEQNGIQKGQHYGNGNGHALQADKNSGSSPSKPHDRKRKHDSEENGDSRNDERRRQNDDFLPRHKRNQPKVAEAYRYVDVLFQSSTTLPDTKIDCYSRRW